MPLLQLKGTLCSGGDDSSARSVNVQLACAFTLIELLVVVAIIAILATLSLPTIDGAKKSTKQAGCLNHLRQLALATQMYSGDNNGLLVPNLRQPAASNSWVLADLKRSATNTAIIQNGLLFRYLGNVAVYRCPAETGPQVLGYSMNCWMGSRTMETQYQQKGYRTFVREAEISATPTPSGLWVMADEHATTLDDGWFLVRMDDSEPFGSFPGIRHQRGFGLNFADGHATILKLRDPGTQVGASVSSRNLDWIRLKEMTTTR